jgi:nicotinamidase-related amidase
MADAFRYEITSVDVDAAQSALLIVDMENEFCRPDGKVYLGERAQPAVSAASRMLARCRDSGIPVIFVRSIREADAMEVTAFGQRPFLVRGTEAVEFAQGVEPRSGEPIVEKHSHDPFNHTTLEEVLDGLGIRPGQHTVMVAGVATSVCVMCAVVGLSVRHLRVALLTDCSASGSERAEEMTYEMLSGSAYSYNVALTTSSRVTIKQPAATPA